MTRSTKVVQRQRLTAAAAVVHRLSCSETGLSGRAGGDRIHRRLEG